MTVDQLPGRVREFAKYLDGLLARLDQGGGWCAVFWQRDPDGMQACLDGHEVPPWDVVEALLQDLAAGYGPAVAAPEKERARALHAAALSTYDARPGGRDALGDRLDVMLREQRYAAERQADLGRLLASATTREEVDTVRLDLAWARDDHERATARCAELRARMEELDRRGVGGQVRGTQAVRRPGADAEAVYRLDGGRPRDSGPQSLPRQRDTRGAAPSGAGFPGPEHGTTREYDGPDAPRSEYFQPGAYDGSEYRDPGTHGGSESPVPGAHGGSEYRAPGAHGGSESPVPGPHDGSGHPAPRAHDASQHRDPGVYGAPSPRYDAPASAAPEPAPITDTPPADVASAPVPAPTPAKQRKRRRGSARFAGVIEEEAAPAVVSPEAVPSLPAPAPAATGRTPRGARFAGAAEAVARVEPEVEPLDAAAGRETAETVRRLVRLRAEGRSGEAHALLVEVTYWPAARFPLLAAELQRAGLGADWATLLWEAAALPGDRLVAAADALVAAGRSADGEQMLRQGVARPAAEIGEAVLSLAGEGRRREVRALLDAYVRVRPPEEAARSVAPDPQSLVPLLLEAAQGVSDERHWDLVHALRVAGFTA
ncbi:hypothetical protein [Streptomyces sp. NPDC001315]|uniref:hypothetical protein n=1 Tax=Streptomyces sp. NPDC001315 TaxID=3364562 RepID=UPI003682A543